MDKNVARRREGEWGKASTTWEMAFVKATRKE